MRAVLYCRVSTEEQGNKGYSNDRGDDSPEGELTDGILDQLAKFERAKTAERTRRGRRKAREGKIVGTGKLPYGLYYADDHYHVDPERMPDVHVCPKRVSNWDNGTCPNRKHYRAEALELQVKDTLADTFREESWIDFVNDTCDRWVEDLRKAHRSDPAKTRERLGRQIDALGTKIARVKDLYVDGDIDKEEYRERRALLEEDVVRVTDERSRLDDLDREMERI